MDTVCFSAEAGRAVQKDHDVAAKLEQLLPGVDRTVLFEQIQAAKSDISGWRFFFCFDIFFQVIVAFAPIQKPFSKFDL